MQTEPPLKLKLLLDDACAEMLKYVVGLENDFPDLLKATNLNIKKCQGLPLAIKEFGCRICNDVLRDDFSPAIEFTTGMFTSLKLSYDVLPANLKRCFAYCSVFPMDYVYKRDHLARLWAVQGFGQYESGATFGDVTRLTSEDVCLGYFDELVRRSFFLPEDSTGDPNNNLSGVKMHSVIHRLCKYVSADDALSFKKSELLQECPQLHRELRHLFVISDKPMEVPGHIPLRTYIYSRGQFDDQCEIKIRGNMLLNLKYLWSLELNSFGIRELPDSIGCLKYLKYLQLKCPDIQELPESIGQLYNLQILDLCGCSRLVKLPSSIGNLIELSYLGLPPVKLHGVDAIERACLIPREIEKLTSLRTLQGIVLSKELSDRGSCGIRELKRLVNLRGEFYIVGLTNLTNVEDAIEADIKSKEFLEVLRLQWREPSESSFSIGNLEERLLENLEPHKNLRELVIIGYGGEQFPCWLSDSSFSNLTKLTLFGCNNDNRCRVLPAFGQLPSLKSLCIGWFLRVWQVGLEFCHLTNAPLSKERLPAFPCLVELSFEEMPKWERWAAMDHIDFPALRKLTIKNCQNLMQLPYFPLLTELTLTGCDGLSSLSRKDHYRQLVRGKKTQADLELPQTSYAGKSFARNKKEKQKSIVKRVLSDENHTNSEVNQQICGREDDANMILEVLLSKESREHNVTSMCIVAPSGVGKTTIIHHVYNSYTVSEAFDKRIWLSISKVHSEKTLMKEIIESVSHLSCVGADLGLLNGIVKEELSGNKFLLILDGAQNENKSFWSSVFTVLDTGAQGSMVVVATKSQAVANAIGSEHCHYLDYLSYDNCWSIFRSLNPKFPSLLIEGLLIESCWHLIEKCQGIPMCVKMIGGCFRNAITEEGILALSEGFISGILPALKACYRFLPFELRKFFAYCALFPKDHIFVKDHIVCMWMSQGLIDHVIGEEAEVIGFQYFDELVARSFLCISPFHDVKDGKFVMHELVHDLAESISQNECFRSEDCLKDVPENISHLSLVPREFKNIELNLVASKISNLETFLVVNRFTPRFYNNGSPVVNLLGLNDVFERHRNIKTLDLSNTDIKELPQSIGLLKSLGFLGISNTKLKNIPPEICILPKLQTLEARNCCDLVELPANLKELTSLRHLDIRKESGFVAIPSGISDLTDLRTLTAFNIGNEKSYSSIRELKILRHLKGELQITAIENIESGNEAKWAELEKKNSLESLVLEWCGSKIGDETGIISKDVLGSLEPPGCLRQIVIRNYTGIEFPVWMDYDFLPKLVSVTLDNCSKCDEFPYLGNLQFLKYLSAEKMDLVQTLRISASARCINHPRFRSLEVLKLNEMCTLKDLFHIGKGDFPRLRSLSISRCPMIRKIPCFPSLVELSLSCCNEFPDITGVSSVKFLIIDRVEKLEILDLRDKLLTLKRLEIRNCKELSSVLLLDEESNMKTKYLRCPKLDLNNVQKLVRTKESLSW